VNDAQARAEEARQRAAALTQAEADAFRTVSADAAEIERRTPPYLARATLYALLALIVVGVAWATFSSIDRIVTAQGRVITRAQPMVIQALETSVVRSILVRVGQSVKKGEQLVSLDATFAEADTSQVKQRLESLSAEVARLETEMAGKVYVGEPGGKGSSEEEKLQADIYEKRTAEYQARLAGFRADVSRLEADANGTQRSMAVLNQRLQNLKRVEAMKADLEAKQFVSQMGLLEAKTQRLEAENAYEDASNKAKQLVEQVSQARHAEDAYVKGWRQKLGEDLVKARRDRDAVREQVSKAERRGALVFLTAPYDATVLEINKRSVGSVAKEADPIISLVPAGDELELEIQIAAEDIGFVRKNDPVRVKLDAFPFQKHGTLNGRLTVIGADSVATDASGSGRQTRAYFTGRVTGMTGRLRAVPADMALVPGMTVVAEIRVGERSVISYFLYPLIKVFDEGIREP
jgi:HlyD family secretion protein